ncbi:type II toxin-antitoxin system RelE/ParE family toxin [Capnocytophaga stomatis]|uniref:Type II toxin-antitoxin system RelE/ParE family toxin n=1 Tax=Capnocytophaga stomatis TaxID=1848904 RepID=A0ABW8Q8A9_9FLAO
MKYEFTTTDDFDKEFKSLRKKYKTLNDDLKKLMSAIENGKDGGVDLGGGFKKIRMKITAKNKGKSGGARVITYETIVNIEEMLVSFVSIYDKSEYENIDIDILKDNLGV